MKDLPIYLMIALTALIVGSSLGRSKVSQACTEQGVFEVAGIEHTCSKGVVK